MVCAKTAPYTQELNKMANSVPLMIVALGNGLIDTESARTAQIITKFPAIEKNVPK
jgi:hypothetical protein